MDIKSLTGFMQTTMLKEIMNDSSMESLTGSSKNTDMFKMILEAVLASASQDGTATGDDQNGIAQLLSLQNSLYGEGSSFAGRGLDINQDVSDSQSITSNTENGPGTIGNTGTRADIEQAIQAAAQKYGVDEAFIRAMVKQESGFRPNAVSGAGAMGLMQLMPKTAESLGVDNPFDVLENIDGGTKYIKRLMDSFEGSKELALSAYNGGIGRMNRRGVDTVAEIENMPKETRNYVEKVMKAYEGYKK